VCKSSDAAVVCDSCVTSLFEFFLPSLPQNACDFKAADINRCLGPFVAPLSASGANLRALVGCDQAALTTRLQKKINCSSD